MTENQRVVELEHALARERQTQFELRRQLLAADETLDRLQAQCAELMASRDNVSRLVAEAARLRDRKSVV